MTQWYVKGDTGKRFHVQMEDEYRVTIGADNNNIMVENLTVPDSCAVHIYDVDGEAREFFRTGQWENFICSLIELNFLN